MRDSRGTYLGAMVKCCRAARLAGLRLLIFRNVRLALRKEIPVLLWMKIFVAREFFEDEIRDLRTQHERNLRTQARLPRLKLDRLEWLLVRSLSHGLKIVRDV